MLIYCSGTLAHVIYTSPLSKNYISILNGGTEEIQYCDYSFDELVDYWRSRWFSRRKKYLIESNRIMELLNFDPETFILHALEMR
jgi:hypothetical protein